MLKLTLGIAVALLAVSCASSGSSQSDTNTPAPASRNRSVITPEELKESTARDAHHAIQLLRPEWLRSRGSASMRDPSPASVTVYVDGQRYGGPSTLEQFRLGSFKELRYYNGSEATSRWGTGHAGGVIYLTTR